MNPYSMLITLPILLFSLSVHEYAHARVAYRLGDNTPRWQGRLTLNPLAHMDPVGLLVLVVTGRFGWAKPVVVNPNNFENRDAGMVMVSLAGPGSNLVLAIALATLFKAVSGPYGIPANAFARYLALALNQGVWINLGLAVFNLLPVPPLDGSKILAALLKGKGARVYYTLEKYSYIVLLLFIATPLASWILSPIILTLYRAIM
ncbi:MAG TPA: site-2 protease family protein [Bacillota bacterium]|nr:site-2 protease family protein [Bacillota bacterium]HOL50569.1 site-2 protease family protein [Bacillota bacterium]HOO30178.1 site-2 protease family protein [Bacillota bacterium]HPQ02099.1 site-2 protease family protein [Bacillota bacterium]HPZ13144.1 site-2 protease family protein [Bacillota bacterium]